MTRTVVILSAGWLILLGVACQPQGDDPPATAAYRSTSERAGDEVVPIDWAGMADYQVPDTEFADNLIRFLNRAARYNLDWTYQQYPVIADQNGHQDPPHIRIPGRDEFQVRPLAHIIHAVAMMLTTGAFSEEATGLSREAVHERLFQLIHGVARAHRGYGHVPAWGYQWQSALWAAATAEGAWLVWESLPAPTRALVQKMIEREADRFLDYRVPYWRNPDDSENYPGDTKGEENAWNSRVLTVAVAMMPRHPNSRRWKDKASELMVSSFATPQDLQSQLRVDGREVQNWLRGYNARPDYLVINHDRLHNDYSAVTRLINKPFITFTLAGSTVPEAAAFNFANVYDAMATLVFSPDDGWAEPGGTMFRRGSDGTYLPNQYYPDPQGTDWSTERYAAFLEMDMFAHVLEVDRGKDYDALEWAKVRLQRILHRQDRHPAGNLFAAGEHREWPPMEAFPFNVVADVWMLTWLTANGDLQTQKNWLEE